MRVLLDTHTLIWSQDDPGKLPGPAATALADPANDRLISVVTVWEIGIKVALAKLALSNPLRPWIQKAIVDMALSELPIALDHIEQQMSLPFHHRDPFDRLLVAQSLVEGAPIVSADTIFDAYGVTRIWD